MIVARVLPNVTGLDKQFDYLVPERFEASVTIGTLVRIPLHGRRVGGWVDGARRAGRSIERLAEGDRRDHRRRTVRRAPRARRVGGRAMGGAAAPLPRRRITGARACASFLPRSAPVASLEPRSAATTSILASGGGVLRLPPTSDPLPCVYSAVALGPTLVVLPALDQARLMGARLRRAGLTVAVVPDEWAAAAGGVDIVIGARTAAWAPCPGFAAAVVIDEHDEALQSESSPTWHARDVVIERCRRADVPVVVVSPCPTVSALHWRPVTRPPVDASARDGRSSRWSTDPSRNRGGGRC